MDPNRALAIIYDTIGEFNRLDSDPNRDVVDMLEEAGNAIAAFNDLDEWLRKGGALPNEWSR